MSQLAKFRCCDFNYLLANKKRETFSARRYKIFWEGAVFRRRHKGLSGEVGGGD